MKEGRKWLTTYYLLVCNEAGDMTILLLCREKEAMIPVGILCLLMPMYVVMKNSGKGKYRKEAKA